MFEEWVLAMERAATPLLDSSTEMPPAKSISSLISKYWAVMDTIDDAHIQCLRLDQRLQRHGWAAEFVARRTEQGNAYVPLPLDNQLERRWWLDQKTAEALKLEYDASVEARSKLLDKAAVLRRQLKDIGEVLSYSGPINLSQIWNAEVLNRMDDVWVKKFEQDKDSTSAMWTKGSEGRKWMTSYVNETIISFLSYGLDASGTSSTQNAARDSRNLAAVQLRFAFMQPSTSDISFGPLTSSALLEVVRRFSKVPLALYEVSYPRFHIVVAHHYSRLDAGLTRPSSMPKSPIEAKRQRMQLFYGSRRLKTIRT